MISRTEPAVRVVFVGQRHHEIKLTRKVSISRVLISNPRGYEIDVGELKDGLEEVMRDD